MNNASIHVEGVVAFFRTSMFARKLIGAWRAKRGIVLLRVVRACTRCVCLVRSGQCSMVLRFPFSLLATGGFPTAFPFPSALQGPIQLQLALSVFSLYSVRHYEAASTSAIFQLCFPGSSIQGLYMSLASRMNAFTVAQLQALGLSRWVYWIIICFFILVHFPRSALDACLSDALDDSSRQVCAAVGIVRSTNNSQSWIPYHSKYQQGSS